MYESVCKRVYERKCKRVYERKCKRVCNSMRESASGCAEVVREGVSEGVFRGC